jgi:hypothetical protein
MEKIEKILQVKNEFDLIYFLISILLCILCSLILKFVFETKSRSYTNQISKIIPILSIVTFLVISVVKSSLALSLGLVGALSIIRFRTPIKNPEDLIYLFLALSIGIGFGANQITITLITFVIIIFLIYFILNKKNNIKENKYNLIIKIDGKNFDLKVDFSKIIKLIKNTFHDADLLKYEKSNENQYALYFNLELENINQLNDLNIELEKFIKVYDFYFFESDDKTI